MQNKAALEQQIEHTSAEAARKNADGTSTKVQFYTGFGWLSADELFDLRQREPRIAP